MKNGVLLLLLLATFAISDAKCPHLMALGGAQRTLLQASAPAPTRAAPVLAAAPGPAAAAAVKSGCNGTRTHPYVGYQGDLTTMDHNVGGHISILDDCTFRVTGFNYDGLAPAAHWKGVELDPMRLDRPLQNVEMLPAGVTWNNISIISVWCEEFLADFGHVILAPGNISSLAPAPAPGNATSFDHCIDLSPNFFQMQWKLDNPDPAMAQAVIISYSAFLDANMWMGFGYSSDSATSAEMIGSDVVIAGMVGEQCFAYSYYLTAKEQCNYEGGQSAGVCPDSGLLGMPHTNVGNSARLISCSHGAGNLVTVTFTRPLKASNKFEHDWPVGAAKYAVWGVGPLSQGSTAAEPVVLFHAPSNKGPTYAASDFKLSLGAPSQCKAILTPQPAGSTPAPTPAASKMQGPQLLDLTKSNMIEITTGTNKNYPNPPAWGLSLHVNGLETPVVRVSRGVPYTFVIKAGETHPIYITDNVNGGGEDSDIIYGGSDSATGTAAMPFTFTWTPNMTTPDTVFYQCYAHRKLGWILQVRNPDGSLANIPNPNKGSVATLASLPVALTNPTTLSASTSGAAAAAAPAPGAAGNSCRAKFGTGGSDDLYAHCVTLTQDAADVRLNWRLDTLAGRRDMTALLQCSNGNGWCAWGLPKSPGQMVGTSAMVVSACSTCPTGAEVEQYYLASKSESGVQPDPTGLLQVLKSEATKLPDGTLQALFTVRLPEDAEMKEYICDSIGASGPLSSSGGLARHDSSASFAALLDLAGGTSTVTATATSVFPVVHGIMMVVAWCMLLPISVVIARTCKHNWPPAWFQIHRALGVIAVAMIAVGLGLGIKAWDGVELTAIFTAHLVLGFLAVALAVLQVTALVYRPKLDAPIRWLWATCHKWTGRKALLVTFANAIIGFNLPDVQLPAYYSWGLAIIWAAIFLAGAGKEVYSRRSLRHKAQHSGLAFSGNAANGKLPHGTNGSVP
ncbi:probable cytochrome b561, DM13 and DOMON domain-containing protein [Coccomyxa sp. Obi]|nr:probable cytochrome b561, DM13 and DOMON domain-containing protein [Coccomyxa sp. Obi]